MSKNSINCSGEPEVGCRCEQIREFIPGIVENRKTEKRHVQNPQSECFLHVHLGSRLYGVTIVGDWNGQDPLALVGETQGQLVTKSRFSCSRTRCRGDKWVSRSRFFITDVLA